MLDDALVLINAIDRERDILPRVSILVVLDDALVLPISYTAKSFSNVVSILVVLDDALVPGQSSRNRF